MEVISPANGWIFAQGHYSRVVKLKDITAGLYVLLSVCDLQQVDFGPLTFYKHLLTYLLKFTDLPFFYKQTCSNKAV